MNASPNIAAQHDRVAGYRFIRRCGGIEEYRLVANGLRVLLMPAYAAPVAVFMLTYEVGSRHETAGFHGVSHMLEHMMFRGSARYNKQHGTAIFDLLHPLGALTNATTWLDRTNFFNLVPADCLDLVAEIEADRMRNLRLDPADLEAERSVVLNEHDQYAGDPLEKLTEAVWSAVFGSHPYGAPVLGTRDDIRGFSRERLLAHYDRYYQPDNATVTVVGDIECEATLALVRHHFEGVPAANRPADAGAAVLAEQRAERRVVIEQPAQSNWVMLAYATPGGRSADADALEVLGGILTGGKLSRLYRPLIESRLASGAWPGVSRLRLHSVFQVQALLGAGQDHHRVERLIRNAIGSIRDNGVSQRELDRAKGRLRGNLLTSRDGPLAVAMQINEAIAAGDWTGYVTAVERIDAVTATDVQRVARDCLSDRRLTVGHLVQRSGGDNATEAVAAAEAAT